ncbi:MAG: class I SAM-dependent methyltransferase [Flavobacterium sp.]|nr:class I SAM-dependent methyltransferase [Flavobacterium sp.]
MSVPFDYLANSYDNSFTNSAVGLAQRKQVWQHLTEILQDKTNVQVLELNCGTGEDAKWLAQNGATVLATDISSEMIKIAEAKIASNHLQQQVVCKQMDIRNIGCLNGEQEKFDIVFSNFGGLNCIAPNEFNTFLQTQLPKLLNTNGKAILVIMPRFCLWETLYYTVKLKFNHIFRRLTKHNLQASLGNNNSIATWYYSPKWLQQHLPSTLYQKALLPIGFFLPPSYVNGFFTKHLRLLKVLEQLESIANKLPILAFASDHYLIHLQTKAQA